MQEKINIVSDISTHLGLTIHRGKSKVLKINTDSRTPITLEGEALEEVGSFTYLGSVVDIQGRTDANGRVKIGKARAAFHRLKNVWGSSDLPLNTKIRIFNSRVKPVLLYGADTWRTTVNPMKKIQAFINICLRRILQIRWPNKISNLELWQKTRQHPIEKEILH